METYAVDWMEWAVHKVIFWETDNERKGRIVRTLHTAAVYALLTMIVVSHTIYPAFWLQTILLVICGLTSVQHVLTNGCVISKVEKRLLKDESSILVGVFLELFRIEATEASKDGMITLGGLVVSAVLALEWLGRLHHKLIPIAQSLVSASVAHIPLPLSSP